MSLPEGQRSQEPFPFFNPPARIEFQSVSFFKRRPYITWPRYPLRTDCDHRPWLSLHQLRYRQGFAGCIEFGHTFRREKVWMQMIRRTKVVHCHHDSILALNTKHAVTMRYLRMALSDLAREHVREEEDAMARGATGSGEALFEAMEKCEHGENDGGVQPRAVQCVGDKAC